MSDKPLLESTNGALYYSNSKKEIYFKDGFGYKIPLGSLSRNTLGKFIFMQFLIQNKSI